VPAGYKNRGTLGQGYGPQKQVLLIIFTSFLDYY